MPELPAYLREGMSETDYKAYTDRIKPHVDKALSALPNQTRSQTRYQQLARASLPVRPCNGVALGSLLDPLCMARPQRGSHLLHLYIARLLTVASPT